MRRAVFPSTLLLLLSLSLTCGGSTVVTATATGSGGAAPDAGADGSGGSGGAGGGDPCHDTCKAGAVCCAGECVLGPSCPDAGKPCLTGLDCPGEVCCAGLCAASCADGGGIDAG